MIELILHSIGANQLNAGVVMVNISLNAPIERLPVYQALSESIPIADVNHLWAYRANFVIDTVYQDTTEISFAYASRIMNYSLGSGTLNIQGITLKFSLGCQIFISREQMEDITLDFCFRAVQY